MILCLSALLLWRMKQRPEGSHMESLVLEPFLLPLFLFCQLDPSCSAYQAFDLTVKVHVGIMSLDLWSQPIATPSPALGTDVIISRRISGEGKKKKKKPVLESSCYDFHSLTSGPLGTFSLKEAGKVLQSTKDKAAWCGLGDILTPVCPPLALCREVS